MNEYCFNVNNVISSDGISYSLEKLFGGDVPIIVCVGTDATIGDALGPLVGTLLLEKQLPCIIYGFLSQPITAREVPHVKDFIEKCHPYSRVLVIDAAVGKDTDVGMIKVCGDGIKPGLGANKNLPKLGDVSIIGVVAKRSPQNKQLFTMTRLRAIYDFAKIIADGVENYIVKQCENTSYA